MEINRTIEIIEALASGHSPKTGELLSQESLFNEREVIRALQVALENLKRESETDRNKEKKPKDDRYKEIDYFRNVKFNSLTESAVDLVKDRIKALGIIRNVNLPEIIVKARIAYPRAYEAWSITEKELLAEAIKFTNDLKLLSECFQRVEGSVETAGQKLIFKSKTKV